MTELRLDLRDSHRRWVGSVTQHMRDVIDDLRRCGVADELFAGLEEQISSLEETTEATPSAPPFLVEALLTRLWVDTCELRATNVEGYGALGDAERGYFDGQARELERLVHALSAAIGKAG